MPFTKKSKEATPVEEGFVIDPQRTYEFVLVGPEIPPFKTIPRNIKVWDEDTQKIRTIRYSRTEQSPFLDQQSKEVPEEIDITFNKQGKLLVPGTNAPLINFLMAHDGIEGKKTINPDNERFRNTYRMINPDQRILDQLETRKIVAKAMAIIDGANIEELTIFMLSQFGFDANNLKDVTRKDDAVLNEAYVRAQSTPAVFVSDFKNKKHEYKSAMIYGFQAGLIDDATDGEVKWTATGSLIHTFDTSKFVRATDALTAWVLETELGKKFYSELKSKLEAE